MLTSMLRVTDPICSLLHTCGSYINIHYHGTAPQRFSLPQPSYNQTHTTPSTSPFTMTNQDHSEGGRFTRTMSRRQEKRAAGDLKRAQFSSAVLSASSSQDNINPHRLQKKAIKKLKRAKSNMESARRNADAAMRNSRADHLHQIMKRPGRGGLSAPGAEQLQRFFSKRVPKSEKLSIGEMDPTASIMVLQMAAEEVDAADAADSIHEQLRQVIEKTVVANGEGDRRVEGNEENGKAEEDMETEKVVEAEVDVESEEEEGLGDEDWEQGGVVLAREL
ncbi:MAG: hypothetical protein Q9175_003941 [Cornicularia normoerica]